MLEININPNHPTPLYLQIVEQIRKLIDNQQLKPGEQIPSVRDLARWLQVNPSTVARAYYDLKTKGLVFSSRRQGTIIIGKDSQTNSREFIEKTSVESIRKNILGTLVENSGLEDLEATFTLHLAHWRVQKSN